MASVHSGLSFSFGAREPKKVICNCGNKLITNSELIACKCRVCARAYQKEHRKKLKEAL